MPLDVNLLEQRPWIAEIVYVPLETALLRGARAKGCPTLDGGGTAVFQAVGAFHIFTDRRRPSAFPAARRSLGYCSPFPRSTRNRLIEKSILIDDFKWAAGAGTGKAFLWCTPRNPVACHAGDATRSTGGSGLANRKFETDLRLIMSSK